VIEVSLIEGARDFTRAEEMSLDVGIRYDNETGAGEASFTVYFADTPEDVFNTPPVITIPAALAAATATDATARFDADTRVLDLFTQERVYLGLEFNYIPSSLELVTGTYTITQLTAHVVSSVEIF
jgi:hypothetical protein